MTQIDWSLAIHGGAGTLSRKTITPDDETAVRAALAEARGAGVSILADGGSALDAVEAAVRALEDDPAFNAGRGSTVAYEGHFELDAAVMDGRTCAAGAVAGVRTIRNPVSLARKVMQEGPHVFLAGAGAEEFASLHGIEPAPDGWFEVERRRRQWDKFRKRKSGWFDADVKYGTVGAVARDRHGHLAAATSTGGLTGKRWGRIGDSPVIGAGTWADDRSCAVSATGSGEFFLRAAAAHVVDQRMRLLGEDLQTAAEAAVAEVADLGGDGGLIAVSADGASAFAFNTRGMYRARCDSTGLDEIAIFAGE
ncbi:isoaspartyl peptidase/L-asparaginase [Altererythrobacter salegens]|uniref:Isoaspartyl peptidase n=1 Tax=Croceibacterium salegens TaxID=1737568 RepID=A0A6I4SUM1_9SPHN|nr:isoaspartyl peptidase/L-asparaginase [Croceibacterium salegens]MXO59814.1 isoaspartyl peptidase/L-asparaginase [Croceibacterium salegens]